MKLQEAIRRHDLAKGLEVSDKTRRGYTQRLKVLEKFFGAERDIATIGTNDLREWRAGLAAKRAKYEDNDYRPTEKGGLSAATLRTYIQAARAFFEFCEREAEIPVIVSPMRDIKLPKLGERGIKAITDDDLNAMVRAAREWSIRDYAVIMFLADTACRAGGLCSLTFDNLDLPNRRAQLREKGEKLNKKRFTPEVAAALKDWIAVRPTTHHRFVFTNNQHRPFSPLTLYRMLERTAERAGVKGRFNPHSFRHGAARAMLLNGASLQDVKEELNHTSIKITSDFYAHLTEDDRAERHDRFSPLGRLKRDEEPKMVQDEEFDGGQLMSDEQTTLKVAGVPRLYRVK